MIFSIDDSGTGFYNSMMSIVVLFCWFSFLDLIWLIAPSYLWGSNADGPAAFLSWCRSAGEFDSNAPSNKRFSTEAYNTLTETWLEYMLERSCLLATLKVLSAMLLKADLRAARDFLSVTFIAVPNIAYHTWCASEDRKALSRRRGPMDTWGVWHHQNKQVYILFIQWPLCRVRGSI